MVWLPHPRLDLQREARAEMTVFEAGRKETLLTILAGIFGTASFAFILIFGSVLGLGSSSVALGLLASGLLTLVSYLYLRKGKR